MKLATGGGSSGGAPSAPRSWARRWTWPSSTRSPSSALGDRIVVRVMVSNYLLKVLWEVAVTPLTYRIVGFLKRAESEDYFDRGRTSRRSRCDVLTCYPRLGSIDRAAEAASPEHDGEPMPGNPDPSVWPTEILVAARRSSWNDNGGDEVAGALGKDRAQSNSLGATGRRACGGEPTCPGVAVKVERRQRAAAEEADASISRPGSGSPPFSRSRRAPSTRSRSMPGAPPRLVDGSASIFPGLDAGAVLRSVARSAALDGASVFAEPAGAVQCPAPLLRGRAGSCRGEESDRLTSIFGAGEPWSEGKADAILLERTGGQLLYAISTAILRSSSSARGRGTERVGELRLPDRLAPCAAAKPVGATVRAVFTSRQRLGRQPRVRQLSSMIFANASTPAPMRGPR